MFKLPMDSVPKAILGIRWGILGFAALCLFVFNLPLLGLIAVMLSLVFGFVLRSARGKVAVIKFLTGVDVSSLVQKPNAPQSTPQGPRNYYRDPLPMSDDQIAAILDREAEPAIRLKRHWPPTEPFAGNSYLGGTPCLPDDLDWPANPKTGLNLHHLAQIDLSEMPLEHRPEGFPDHGTLWFFADIDEELVWHPGPDSQHSAVLYSPRSVSDCAPAAVPERLPEVDHTGRHMTGTPWAHRGPKFSVYPRWPVTGHTTLAWAYSDMPPSGVTDPVAYANALSEREAAEKAVITGARKERESGQKVIAHVAYEKRRHPDGTPYTYERAVYTPDLWGGRFPYSARFADLVLKWMKHKQTAEYSYSDQILGYTQAREVTTPEDETAKQQKIKDLQDQLAQSGPWLERIKALHEVVKASAPEAPLEETAMAEMDALMAASLDQSQMTSMGGAYVRNAAIDFTGLAMSDPSLLDEVPTSLLQQVEGTTHPAHSNTNHFLLGPKGCASNPTVGKGIRLAQFDSDYAMRFMFCDVGIVDFWIDPADLADGRWDRAWAATAGG